MLQYQAPLEAFNLIAHKVLRRSELLPLLPARRHSGTGLAIVQVGTGRQERC